MVALEPLSVELAARDQARRIEQNKVELAPAVAARLEEVDGIALFGADPLGHAIAAGVLVDPLQGMGRTVDTGDAAGTGQCRLNTPAADVAVEVEHPPCAGVDAESGAVEAMVIEPAGFLPALGRRHETAAILADLKLLRQFAAGHLGVFVQPFDGAKATLIAPDQRGGRIDGRDGGFEHRLQLLHAGAADLADHHLAVAVEHQSRQGIAVAIDPAVVIAGEELPAQPQCGLQSPRQHLFVDDHIALTAVESGRNQGVGVDQGTAERFALGAGDRGQGAGGELGQR